LLLLIKRWVGGDLAKVGVSLAPVGENLEASARYIPLLKQKNFFFVVF